MVAAPQVDETATRSVAASTTSMNDKAHYQKFLEVFAKWSQALRCRSMARSREVCIGGRFPALSGRAGGDEYLTNHSANPTF